MEGCCDIDLLLIGKTGSGKSSTGNTLLRKAAFETNSRFDSCTKHEQICSTEFQGNVIKVVDTPGLDFEMPREKPSYHYYSHEVRSQSDYRVDAFLVVVKFAVRFTHEDLDLLYASKKFFGEGFIKHSIIIVSGGDHFNDVLKEKQNVSFHDWIREQSGCFRQLLKACGGRCVLFNNKEKDEASNKAQVRQLLELVKTMKSCRELYLARPKPLFWKNPAVTSDVESYEQVRKCLEEFNRAYPQSIDEGGINELKEMLQKIKLQNEKRNCGRKLAVEVSEGVLSWSTVVTFVTAALRHTGSVVTSIVTRNIDNKTEHIKPE